MARPTTKKERLAVWLPVAVVDAIRQEAAMRRLSLSYLVEEAFRARLVLVDREEMVSDCDDTDEED